MTAIEWDIFEVGIFSKNLPKPFFRCKAMMKDVDSFQIEISCTYVVKKLVRFLAVVHSDFIRCYFRNHRAWFSWNDEGRGIFLWTFHGFWFFIMVGRFLNHFSFLFLLLSAILVLVITKFGRWSSQKGIFIWHWIVLNYFHHPSHLFQIIWLDRGVCSSCDLVKIMQVIKGNFKYLFKGFISLCKFLLCIMINLFNFFINVLLGLGLFLLISFYNLGKHVVVSAFEFCANLLNIFDFELGNLLCDCINKPIQIFFFHKNTHSFAEIINIAIDIRLYLFLAFLEKLFFLSFELWKDRVELKGMNWSDGMRIFHVETWVVVVEKGLFGLEAFLVHAVGVECGLVDHQKLAGINKVYNIY